MATTNDTNIFGYSNVLRGDIPSGGDLILFKTKTENFSCGTVPNIFTSGAISISAVTSGYQRQIFHFVIIDSKNNYYSDMFIFSPAGIDCYKYQNKVLTNLENNGKKLGFNIQGLANGCIFQLGLPRAGNFTNEKYTISLDWLEIKM